MKTFISYLLLAAICSFLLNCKSETKPAEVKIVEKADSNDFIESRSSDSVDGLYKELLKENKALADLEKSTNALLEKKTDVEKPFQDYNSRNEDYYTSAKRHLNSIRDSVLKQKYIDFIEKSLKNYTLKSGDLRKIIEANKATVLRLEDLRIALKLTETLAFMEKYQDKAIPDKKPLEDINNELGDKAAKIQQKIRK